MNNKKHFSLLFILSCMLIWVSSAMAQCDQHKDLIATMDKAMEDKNPELLRQVYHQDAVRHTWDATTTGLENLIANAKQFYKEVPDATGKNEEVICTDDRIVIRWTGTGTPVQARGKKIKVTGITIAHVKDGKVVEEWEEMNALSMMQQVGFELKPPSGGK